MQIHGFVSVCQGIHTREKNCLPVFLYVVVGEQGVQGSERESREGMRCSFCIPDGTSHTITLLLKWAHYLPSWDLV